MPVARKVWQPIFVLIPAVVQGFFAGQIRQVEPVLNEVDAQHALQTNGRTSVAPFWVVGFDDFTQCRPRHDGLHGLEELIAPRRLAVMLESLISCHGKS